MLRLLIVSFLFTLPAALHAQGRNHAFMVACGEYDNDKEFGKLPFTIKELLEFKDVLVASGEYKEADIKLLHNDVKDNRFKPRRKRIVEELDILLNRLNEDDTLLVVLNGHGIQPRDDPSAYFCPIDASVEEIKSCIPLEGKNGLFEKLKETKLKRKLLIVNACRDDPNKPTMASRKVDLFDKKHKYESPVGIAALFSCQPGQFSYYYPDEKETKGRQRSLFFHHLIEGWQGKYSAGKEINLEDVFREVKERTSLEADSLFGDSQVPFMRREYAKEWVIARGSKKTPSTPSEEAKNLTVYLDDKKSVKLELIRIDPKSQPDKGTFTMGSSKAEQEAVTKRSFQEKRPFWLDAENAHEVTLTKAYYIGKYHVTRGQFRAFVDATGYKAEEGVLGVDADTGKYVNGQKYSWRNPGFEQSEDHPVVCVNWNDAVKFCEWCSGKTGKKMGLPSEAQWEYACRAGSTTTYFFGDDEEQMAKYGNIVDGTAKDKFGDWRGIDSKDGYVFTSPVGKFRPNAFGLFDMHGNAYQWCGDWYGKYAGTNLIDPTGPATGDSRVVRGGSFRTESLRYRSAYRMWYSIGTRFALVGFRVACAVEE